MEGYTHTDNSLVTIYERLKNLNAIYDDMLSAMHSQQRNQIANLSELGMVLSAPQKDLSVGITGNPTPPAPTPSLIVCVLQELDKLDRALSVSKNQVEDARFIGEALYRQMARPMNDAPVNEVSGMKERY